MGKHCNFESGQFGLAPRLHKKSKIYHQFTAIPLDQRFKSRMTIAVLIQTIKGIWKCISAFMVRNNKKEYVFNWGLWDRQSEPYRGKNSIYSETN